MSWRVGSKTGVTLFKGDVLYGMMLTPEKAAVVARWLNWADMVTGRNRSLLGLTDGQLRLLSYSVRRELELRGIETAGRQAEGGAEGDPAAAVPDGGIGAGDPLGAGDGGSGAEGDGRVSIWGRVSTGGGVAGPVVAAAGRYGWADMEEGETSLTEAVKMPVEKPRADCPDCGVGIGEEHSVGCGVARCLGDGLRRLDCRIFNGQEDSEVECGNDLWSGFRPGVSECEEFGWVTMDLGSRYVIHDLNRLVTECRWDRGALRWRRR